jgi:hypothetical protein
MSVIEFNIGGEIYFISKETLSNSDTYFEKLLTWENITRDSQGRIYIDRDGALAKPIFNYLRTKKWQVPTSINSAELLSECEFYNIRPSEHDHVSDESIRHTIFQNREKRLTSILEDEICRSILEGIITRFMLCAEKGEIPSVGLILNLKDFYNQQNNYIPEMKQCISVQR